MIARLGRRFFGRLTEAFLQYLDRRRTTVDTSTTMRYPTHNTEVIVTDKQPTPENFADDVQAEQLPAMLQLSLEEMEQFANQGVDPGGIAAFNAKPGMIKVIEQKNGLIIFNAVFVFHKDAFKGASRAFIYPSANAENDGFETTRAKDIHKALMGSRVRFYLQKDVFNLEHWKAVSKGEVVAGPTARVIRG